MAYTVSRCPSCGRRMDDRSAASHAHQFAWLTEAWQNLPEDIAPQYPTAEHLRKRALIQAGFYDEDAIDCGSKDGAERVAAYAQRQDEFAVVMVRGQIVLVRRAKSQSKRDMDRAEFQRSKDAILEIVAGMIGVTPQQLVEHAGQAA